MDYFTIIIIISIFSDATIISGCESGWSGYGGHCYYLSTDEARWTKARDDCRNKGDNANLVSIHSKEENDFIISLIGYEAVRWIGMYWSRVSSVWGWIDGSTYTGQLYDNGSSQWDDGEPDGSGYYVRFKYHKWRDSQSNAEYQYICKTASTTTTPTTTSKTSTATTTTTTPTTTIATITQSKTMIMDSAPTTTTTDLMNIVNTTTTTTTSSTSQFVNMSSVAITEVIAVRGKGEQTHGTVLPWSVAGAALLVIVIIAVVVSVILIKRHRRKSSEGHDRDVGTVVVGYESPSSYDEMNDVTTPSPPFMPSPISPHPSTDAYSASDEPAYTPLVHTQTNLVGDSVPAQHGGENVYYNIQETRVVSRDHSVDATYETI